MVRLFIANISNEVRRYMRPGENCDLISQMAIIQKIIEAHTYLDKILSHSNEIYLPN